MEKEEFENFLAVIVKKYGSRVPEFSDLWGSCTEPDFDQALAMTRISALVMKHGIMSELKIPQNSLVLDQNGKRSLSELLGEHGITSDELVYENEKGQPTINPLYIAALAEKAQFDGDTPELRIGGDLPEGADPAVPVDTEAISLLVIGDQLNKASQEVKDLLDDARERRFQKSDEAFMSVLGATGDTTELVKVVENSLAEALMPLSVEGYEGGKIPTLRKVNSLTGSEILAISPADRKKLAWKAMSTTQGRNSASPVMGKLLEKRLRAQNLDVTYVTGWSDKETISEGRWVLNLKGGNLNPQFDTVNIAVLSLLRQIGTELEIELPLEVEVKSVNLYSMREVGWKARVVYKNPPKKLSHAEEGLQSRVEGG